MLLSSTDSHRVIKLLTIPSSGCGLSLTGAWLPDAKKITQKYKVITPLPILKLWGEILTTMHLIMHCRALCSAVCIITALKFTEPTFMQISICFLISNSNTFCRMHQSHLGHSIFYTLVVRIQFTIFTGWILFIILTVINRWRWGVCNNHHISKYWHHIFFCYYSQTSLSGHPRDWANWPI